jgi:hypothetical protein
MLLVATAALLGLLSLFAVVWALASRSYGDVVISLLGVLFWYWIGAGALKRISAVESASGST